MNILHKILISGTTGCLLLATSLLFTSCGEDKLSDTSIFLNEMANARAVTAFDKWLDARYVRQYNIELKYRLEDTETDYTYHLIPADEAKAIRMSHAILYGCLQSYDEVAGQDFTRRYAPKLIQLIGSYPYDSKGSVKLGTAEDGLKITFYNVNGFSTEEKDLSSYFQVMHHEFTHILTQNKEYDTSFRTISDSAYITAEWKKKTETEALTAGFISNYAMSEYNEDFAETLSFYLIYTPTVWNAKMKTAGTKGAAILNKKLEIIRSYMLTAWGIDIDQMRDVLQRRLGDIVAGKVDLESVEI